MPWLLSSPGQHQPWNWLCQSRVSQLHYHPCHGWQMPSEVTWAYLPPPLITINIELLTHWWLGHITCYGRQMIDMGINMQNKMVKPFWCWDWNIPCVARPSPTTILIMSATNKPTALPSMPWLADAIEVTWAYLPPPQITINIELLTHWWLGYIACHGQQMINMGINRPNKTLNCSGAEIDIAEELGQYHGWWCPGSLRRQAITKHDID